MSGFEVVRALLLAATLAPPAYAEQIQVAVAANFAEPMKILTADFEAATGHRIILVVASTGKIYAQITNGAPFDVFFAADSERPQRLEEAGLTVAGSRKTYAIGRLVLWSADPELVDTHGKVLETGSFTHLAIAKPKLAPYGRAAQEVLETTGLWADLFPRTVQGENIGQTFAFVKTGTAELGFVAASQVFRPGQPMTGSVWEVPPHLHSPIEQQVVRLSDSLAARAFVAFVTGDEARELIRGFGYRVP